MLVLDARNFNQTNLIGKIKQGLSFLRGTKGMRKVLAESPRYECQAFDIVVDNGQFKKIKKGKK